MDWDGGGCKQKPPERRANGKFSGGSAGFPPVFVFRASNAGGLIHPTACSCDIKLACISAAGVFESSCSEFSFYLDFLARQNGNSSFRNGFTCTNENGCCSRIDYVGT